MPTLESNREPRLVPGLACPACHHPLGPVAGSSLTCVSCQARYPVVDGIPSFVSGGAAEQYTSSGSELSVIVVGTQGAIDPGLLDEIARLGVAHDVSAGNAADVAAALQRSRGRYVMTIDARAIGLIPRLWAA